MLNTRFVWLVVLSLFFSGCVTGDKVSAIRPGMTKAQVERVMGHPDAYEKSGQQEAYTYANRLMSGWSWDKADYVFLFQNDQLVKYGPGNIQHREWQPNTRNIIVTWRSY